MTIWLKPHTFYKNMNQFGKHFTKEDKKKILSNNTLSDEHKNNEYVFPLGESRAVSKQLHNLSLAYSVLGEYQKK